MSSSFVEEKGCSENVAVDSAIPDSTLLLVGSTGTGKSTLGNFLVDPTGYLKNPVFARGDSYFPTTRSCSANTFTYRDKHISIIDTPGLNENATKDFEHMLELVQLMHKTRNIQGLIICYNMENNVDEQFKNTVKYYTKLFPNLVANNLLLVLTNFKMDSETIVLRDTDNFDLNGAIVHTTQVIQAVCNFNDAIPCLNIDALPPIDAPEEYNQAFFKRCEILEQVLKMPPVEISKLLLRKTREIQDAQEKLIRFLKGKIMGCKIQLLDSNSCSQEILDKIDNLAENIASRGNVPELEDELVEICGSHRKLVDLATFSRLKYRTIANLKLDYLTIEDAIELDPTKCK